MWYKSFGYSKNPLKINPLKEKTSLIGRDKELQEALYYIASGSMVFIECESGNGRTKFLKHIINDFENKIIYVNARKLKKNLDVETYLKKKNSPLKKLFSKKIKNMILVIDNVEELSPINLERLKLFFDNNQLRSVVFTGNSLKKSILPQCIKHRIGNKIISLKPFTNDQVVDIVLEKLESSEEESIISKDLIIFRYAKYKNLREFLIYADLAATKMVEANEEKLLEKYFANAKKAFDVKNYIDESLIDTDGTTIMKIGNYYRNPFKESFCSVCGAIVNLEDKECPECGSKFAKEVKNSRSSSHNKLYYEAKK